MPEEPISPKVKAIFALIGLGALVVILVVALFALGELQGPGAPLNPNTVTVSAVNWQWSGPDVALCWESSTGGSVSGPGGSTLISTLSINRPSSAVGTCTLESLAIQTSGFSIVNTNAPISISPGGSQTISVTLQTPNQNWAGAVTIIGAVSWSYP